MEAIAGWPEKRPLDETEIQEARQALCSIRTALELALKLYQGTDSSDSRLAAVVRSLNLSAGLMDNVIAESSQDGLPPDNSTTHTNRIDET